MRWTGGCKSEAAVLGIADMQTVFTIDNFALFSFNFKRLAQPGVEVHVPNQTEAVKPLCGC